MLVLIAAVGLLPPLAQSLFDAAVADLRRLKKYSVQIESFGRMSGENHQARYDLAVAGADALLRIREPAKGIMDHTDRSYLLHGSHLIAYDAFANERIQREASAKGSLEDRFAGQLGQLDLPLRIVLSPDDLRKFLAGFRSFHDWRTSHAGDVVTLQRFVGGASTLFRFTGQMPMLTEVRIQAKDSEMHLIYAFRRDASPVLLIPSDARHVTAFTEREAPPTYASPEAKMVVAGMIRAYGRLQNGEIVVESDAGNSRLVLAGRRLREDRAHFTWAYDGTTLSMHDTAKKRFYRGKAPRPILAEYIAKIGGGVDPLIERLLAHRTPYADLFRHDAIVKEVGTAGADDILDVSSSMLRLSLFVRRDTHLLASMESETRDAAGHTLTRSSRRFTYQRLGVAPASAEFRLSPGGAKVMPLPEIVLNPAGQ